VIPRSGRAEDSALAVREVGAGADVEGGEAERQPATMTTSARRREEKRSRMREGNVGRASAKASAKPLAHRRVQFIDHPLLRGLYSRFMEVFPPEAHA
jgi:hypothetical protein